MSGPKATFGRLATRRRTSKITVFSGVVASVAVAALISGVILLPPYFIEWRHLQLTAKDQLDAEGGLRSSLIQLLGGLFLLAGLYFTSRGFRLTREGHITDRYAKAIEQLGHENTDVRIGGIYALERIALDSSADRSTIIEVLTTFIREHTRSGHRTPSTAPAGADVQAALSVLARRPNVRGETDRLDFYHSGLNEVDFRGGDFRHAMFDYSLLNGALFSGTNLDHADLSFCRARRAAFTNSVARGAHFVNAEYTQGWFLAADLTDADFFGCDLTGSDFGRQYAEEGNPPLPPATLTNARFENSTLKGTNLRGVDLRTVAGLTPEQLRDAITDKNTITPVHWGGVNDNP